MKQSTAPIVLVVDDEAEPLKVIGANLAAQHYQVLSAMTGGRALELVAAGDIDVLIVDFGLPDIDGIELCRRLRRATASPIIVVTGDGTEERMVQALDEGADGYMVKPFSMAELMARVRVAIRHRKSSGRAADVVVVGALVVDVGAHVARIDKRMLRLSPPQFLLLTILARNSGRVLAYPHLSKQLWGVDEQVSAPDALRAAVSKLRRSLGEGEGVPKILTEPHIGYRLVEIDTSRGAG